MNKSIIIDAKDSVLGRIAALAAKQALLGKTVTVINCNEAIITGSKPVILKKYKSLRAKGGSSLKGPIISKAPERIMKRTIRGMLSHRQGRGEQAFARIMCYNKTPAEFESSEKISLKKPIKTRFITLTELSGEL
ncbi:50S ribosomal protein L13 [Candidatus Pacearchaeota archaeon]|nr:50S ribosomal protein L13 [Candidatus Pacearchaeota archaeon]